MAASTLMAAMSGEDCGISGVRGNLAHDPEKLVLDLIGDGHRFSGKIMRQ
jgi:hypothetical protein